METSAGGKRPDKPAVAAKKEPRQRLGRANMRNFCERKLKPKQLLLNNAVKRRQYPHPRNTTLRVFSIYFRFRKGNVVAKAANDRPAGKL